MVSDITALARASALHRIASPKPVEIARSTAISAPSKPAPTAMGPPSDRLSPTTSSALFGVSLAAGEASAFAAARAAGAYGLASMAPTEPLTPKPPTLAMEEVSQVGFLWNALTPGDTTTRISQLRDEISDLRDSARREKQLSDSEGVAVRIAYDPNRGEEVALRPGDAGYEDVRGAQAGFSLVRRDLDLMGLNVRDFADLLAL